MEEYFKNFKKYAFRLELLQEYDVEEEKEAIKKFLKSNKIEPDKEWINIIKKARRRKAIMHRARVIKLPLMDYLKFEIKAYQFNIASGENIYFIYQEEFDKLNSEINYDFWLFDDKIVLKMNYNNKGKFMGFVKIKSDIDKYIKFKDRLLSIAKPMKELER